MKKKLTTPIQQVTTKMDVNGNKTAHIQCVEGAFSIQTLGNLPETHSRGVGTWTAKEVYEYVDQYGTKRQKRICTPELY